MSTNTATSDPYAHLENPDANPELNEKFWENRDKFDTTYREVLSNILWEEWNDLLWKIAGSFELSGDINKAVEINVDSIKNLQKSEEIKATLIAYLYDSWDTQNNNNSTEDIPENLQSDDYNPNLETQESLSQRQEKIDFQKNLWETAKENLSNDLALEPVELDQKLNDTSEKKKNTERMEAIIYKNEWFLEQFMWKNSQEIEENKTLLAETEVQEDLDSILSKCVLPVEAHSVQEVYNKAWEKWVEQINRSLNYAFEIQISEILEWKMNFPKETINNLCQNIYNGNPVEKIVNFEKIKSIIHTNEWMWWAKQSREFKNKTTLNNLKNQVNTLQFEEIRDLLLKANQTTLKQLQLKETEIKQILAMEKESEEADWDIFWGNLEIEWISENNENVRTA